MFAPPRLHLRLIGHMAVADATGRPLLPRTRKTRALLAVLAMSSPKPVLRMHLAALLWSRREKEQARASLRQSVHELQDILAPDWNHLFVTDRHHLSLRGDGLAVDVLDGFRSGRGGPALLAGPPDRLLEDLDGLDPAFDAWLTEERLRLSRPARGGDPAVSEALEGAMPSANDPVRDVSVIMPGSMPPAVGRRTERSAVRVRVAALRTIGDIRDDTLAVGLAEEISAGLSRFRWISCLPALPRPEGADAADADGASWFRDGMDADLMLDGTIQRTPSRVRIIVRLIDLRARGEIVWAGRFDREMADRLTLQDELGATIVAQIDPALLRHEGLRASFTQPDDMTAQDLLLRALPGIYRLERPDFLASGRLLKASLAADPANSVAHGWLAYWNLLSVGQGWADDPVAATAEAARLAERAVTLDPGDARALTLAGHVRGFLSRHPAEAIALHDRAISLNPNLAIAWCFSGFSYSYLGDHEEALRRINHAIRLSPADPHAFFFDMALVIVQLMRGDYISAVEAGRRAIELNPLFSSGYKSYLSALGWLGRMREATEVRDRLLALEPGFSVSRAVERSPFMRPEDVERYAEGLKRAGLPGGGGPSQSMPGAAEIAQSLIDLAPEAQHSPLAMRDDSQNDRGLQNDTFG